MVTVTYSKCWVILNTSLSGKKGTISLNISPQNKIKVKASLDPLKNKYKIRIERLRTVEG